MSDKKIKKEVYGASAIGAILLGVADFINNNENSIYIRISNEILPNQLHAILASFVILIILGCMVCWVSGGETKADGFARGFSIYAVLSIASPNLPVPTADNFAPNLPSQVSESLSPTNSQKSTSFFNQYLIKNARASFDTIKAKPLKGTIEIYFNERINNNILMIVKSRNGRIIDRRNILKNSTKFFITKKYGQYILELSGNKLKSVSTIVKINTPYTIYDLKIEPSNLPTIIQRFAPATKVKLKKNQSKMDRKNGAIASRDRNYEKAIEFYNTSLKLNPNDAKTYNFKGYSLYHLKRYEEAKASLEKSIYLDSDYYIPRLNLAKLQCIQDQPTLAEEILSPANLNAKQSDSIANDYELKQVCGKQFIKNFKSNTSKLKGK